jgi:hypothetical protein
MRMDCGGVRVSPLPQKEASYVSDGPRGISPSAVHRQRELAVSSSLELVASFRVLRPATCLAGPTTSRRAELRSASLGVPLPHRGTSKRRPPMRGIPDPALRSVLGVSHALDGLLRHLPCGFVSPRSHVQGLPSRGLSLARSRTGFPRPVHALLALDAKSLRCDPRQPLAPSTSGLSLPAASAVASGTCLGSHPLRAPPGLCLLRVFPPRTAETISRFLHPRPSFGTSPSRLALGVSTARGAVDLCPGYRPARGS